ncbi:hypothetical protein HOY80DRAFT_1032390 [Tuber brumale]|nr:hypothetical protein HOY80DRAFT_1032390 [Tuber brumale]
MASVSCPLPTYMATMGGGELSEQVGNSWRTQCTYSFSSREARKPVWGPHKSLEDLQRTIRDPYRLAFVRRLGVGIGHLPAGYIQGGPREVLLVELVEEEPRVPSQERRVTVVAELLKGTRRQLVVIWRGPAYARPEGC